jgi:hypothetical protein
MFGAETVVIVPTITQNACNRCLMPGQPDREGDLMPLDLGRLRIDLENVILSRTGRRIRNLDVELKPEGVVLHGVALSYHGNNLRSKECEFLPDVQLENAIEVA